jgi:hypothetical protein
VQIGSPYVDTKIVEAIHAKAGQGKFEVTNSHRGTWKT